MRVPASLRFTLLVLLAAFLADRLCGWVLDRIAEADHMGQSVGQLNRYLLTPRPDVLVMGSSRAHHGIDPERISPGGYNLSHNGMNVVFQAGVVDVLEHRGALPQKLLVMQLQPEDLITGAAAMAHMQFLKHQHGQAPYVTSAIDGLRWSERLKYLASTYRYNGSALTIPLNAWRSMRAPAIDGNGFEPAPTQANDSERVVLSRQRADIATVATFDTIPTDPMATAGGLALTHVREVCERNGIRLVLFTAPYYACSPARRAGYERLDPLIRAAGFTYFDYAQPALPELAPISLWTDNDHVDLEGAGMLTARLKRDLIAAGALDSVTSTGPPPR